MSKARSGHIREINGPILRIHLPGGRNGEQVRIGSLDIVGEIIALEGDDAIVQAYESTDGLRPGEAVEGLGHPLTVELGPGLLQGIFDGVQRPLDEIAQQSGDNIPRGLRIHSLERGREWPFVPREGLEPGATIGPGERLGTVQETETIEHRVLVPPHVRGELIDLVAAGSYCLDKTIARVRDDQGEVHKLKLYHRWPVRLPRPSGNDCRARESSRSGRRRRCGRRWHGGLPRGSPLGRIEKRRRWSPPRKGHETARCSTARPRRFRFPCPHSTYGPQGFAGNDFPCPSSPSPIHHPGSCRR